MYFYVFGEYIRGGQNKGNTNMRLSQGNITTRLS